MQLFTLPISGGTPRQLTSSEVDHGAPIWAKDNAHLFFAANLHKESDFEPADSDILRIDIKTGEIKKLTDRYGPDHSPLLSPDGSKIAYLGYDDRLLGYQVSQLYVMDADGSDPRLVSQGLDRDVEQMAWNQKGNGLYIQ